MEIVIERGRVWDLDAVGRRTIGLDGAIQGPHIDPDREVYSFDHHAGCVRLVTSATCQQVYDALSVGLDPEGFTVLVNDVDGDTALAVALLKHPEWVGDQRVATLVNAVGKVDSHGPVYRLAGSERELADQFFLWAMSPQSQALQSGAYQTCDLGELLDVCVARIEKLVSDDVPVKERDRQRAWTVTHSGDGWVMVHSDSHVFDLVYEAGHDAGICWQRLRDGTFAYTVARRSDLVSRFPVPTILAALNTVEAGWGGGSSVGGGPRNVDGSRSKLTPDEVFEIVSSTLS